jgi:hypothetical protein
MGGSSTVLSVLLQEKNAKESRMKQTGFINIGKFKLTNESDHKNSGILVM